MLVPSSALAKRWSVQTHLEFPNLFLLDHPLIQHKLTLLRRADTPTGLFRELLKETALLMGYEVTRPLPITTVRIETPLVAMEAPVLAGKKPAIVSILRAGLGMAEGLHALMQAAREGHIGLNRDTARSEEHTSELQS